MGLLTVGAVDPSVEIEMPVLSLDAGNTRKPKLDKRKAEKPAPKVEKPIEKAAPTEEAAAEDEEAPRKSRNRRRRRGGTKGVEGVEPVENGADEAQAAPAPAPIIEHEPFLPTPVEAQSEEAKRASAFLSGLTERMGVPVAIALQESSEQLRMQMTGEGMSLLIGRRGETLDALQYLTSRNINRGREEYLRVSIDTENYRAKREEALRKLAIRMAGRAKKSGRRVALEPMNPYERRILHSALQDDPDVTTHSEGEEPYRRVIITLK